MENNELSKVSCEVCSLIWGALVLIGCTYIVFWLGQSGWWYAFAVLLLSFWSCKYMYNQEDTDGA